MSPEALAQGQLDAYNAQDLDRFMSFYADDVVIAELNGAVLQQGTTQVRERYATMFAKFPANRAALVSRIVVGNTVVDHEDVQRAPDNRFEACAIYTVRGDKIARVDFAS
jgi:hypothetical protein